MIRRLATLAALVLLAAAPAPPPAHPALWKVSDADTTIYLFGTIHVLPAGTKWQSAPIAQAVARSAELKLEIPESKDPQAVAGTLFAMGAAKGLPPLLQRVPPRRRAALARLVARSGMPMAALDGMKTWVAGFVLTAVNLQDLGLDARNGVEEQLTASFDSAGKPVTGLETVGQQLGFFDALPEGDQRQFLLGVIDDGRTARAEYATMLAAWTRGDERAIAATFDDELEMTPTLRAALLTRRNQAWAKWIAGRMAEPGTLFVAVGAGHLAGAGSVPRLLAADGLKVERVE